MAGHIIVCGLGDVGFRVVELLDRLGEAVHVVTDRAREERLRAVEERDIPVLLGDARNEHLLVEAGLLSAKALLAGTDKDLTNIEIALDARRYRPDLPIVLRLFDQELARQLEPMLQVRRALGMSSLAAPSFAAAALGDAILAGFQVGGVPYVIGRQPVAGGPLAGVPTVGALAREERLQTLLQEAAAGLTTLPPAAAAVAAGDRLTLLGRKADWDRFIGAPEDSPPAGEKASGWARLGRMGRRVAAAWRLWKGEPLLLRLALVAIGLLLPAAVFFFHYYLRRPFSEAFFVTVTNLYGSIVVADGSPQVRLFQVVLLVLGSISLATLYSLFTAYLVGFRLKRILGGQPMPRGGHVIVVGVGRVGFRILEELRAMGVPVVAVNLDPDAPLLGGVRAVAPVVAGDARSAEVLAQARLPAARAVIGATGDDAVNLSICLTAKRANPRVRTVSRLFDPQFARKVESLLGVDVAMSASRVAAPTFTAALLEPDVVKAVIVENRFFVLVERPPAETGQPPEPVPEVSCRELAAAWGEEGAG